MKLFNRLVVLSLNLIIVSIVTGCASNPNAESWKLPKKESPESAMIIGRVDITHNKTENPDGDLLYLQAVNFMLKDEVYWWDGSGEKNFVLDNNYFIVPNIKPGKYYFRGFYTAHGFNTVTDPSTIEDKDYIDVKAGEIKFVGSFDYVKNSRSFVEKIKNMGTFQLRKTPHPTEKEMLQWLNRIGAGSGWEAAIKKRIQQ